MPSTLRGPFVNGAAPTYNYAPWLTDIDDAAFRFSNDVFNVKDRDYGAVADGTTNDEPAIQAAVDAASTNGGIVFLPPGTYAISNPIDMKANTRLIGSGMGVTTIKIKTGTGANFASKYMVQSNAWPSNVSNVYVSDLTLDGNGATLAAGQGGGLVCGSHWIVERIRFTNFAWFKLDIAADTTGTANVKNVIVRDCRFEATGPQGYDNIGAGNVTHLLIEGCYWKSDISGNVIDLVTTTHFVIRNCYMETNSMYIEACTNGLIEGNWMTSGRIGLLSNATYASAGPLINARYITVRDNHLDTPGDYGIQIHYDDFAGASSHLKGGGNKIIGNTITSPNKVGILKHGDDATRQDVGDVIANNVIVNPNSDSTNTYDTGEGVQKNAGVAIGNGRFDVVTGNSISDINGVPKMQYGLSLGLSVGGTARHVTQAYVAGNRVFGHTTAVAYTAPNDSLNANTVLVNHETADTLDVASATTVTLPHHSQYFNITGTTTITSVTASWIGRQVTLKFAGVLTFTDGSNLKLAGNFVTTADDTITLVCDGTNWFEVGRSVN